MKNLKDIDSLDIKDINKIIGNSIIPDFDNKINHKGKIAALLF